jgi:hypothetical protein
LEGKKEKENRNEAQERGLKKLQMRSEQRRDEEILAKGAGF